MRCTLNSNVPRYVTETLLAPFIQAYESRYSCISEETRIEVVRAARKISVAAVAVFSLALQPQVVVPLICVTVICDFFLDFADSYQPLASKSNELSKEIQKLRTTIYDYENTGESFKERVKELEALRDQIASCNELYKKGIKRLQELNRQATIPTTG